MIRRGVGSTGLPMHGSQTGYVLNSRDRRYDMEPLHPVLRVALKEAHPELTDEDIDRAEELMAQRMRCDPEKEKDRIAKLDRERLELIQRKMPRYADVVRASSAKIARPPEREANKVTVTMKTPKP